MKASLLSLPLKKNIANNKCVIKGRTWSGPHDHAGHHKESSLLYNKKVIVLSTDFLSVGLTLI